jgi:outer membrane protein assembly factor BamA
MDEESPMVPIRCLPALILLLLASLPAPAQPPAFPIEEIEIRGARFASAEVVARESLLARGATYTEPQLRAAMSRINRLPFVLDSSFALEKGTERGSYVLVITIVETKPLFAEASFDAAHWDGSTQTRETFRAGGRWFFGTTTLVHAATDFENNYEAGLTQYNLFGRPGYVALIVKWAGDRSSTSTLATEGGPIRLDFSVDPSPEVRFGFPVRGDHSIVGSWERRSGEMIVTSPGHLQRSETTSDIGGVAWLYDTTDDPILPTAGMLWRTGVGVGLFRGRGTLDGGAIERDSTRTSLSSVVTRYQPLSERASVYYGLAAGAARSDNESHAVPQSRSETTWYSPQIGISASLWPDRLTRRFGDLRFDTRAVYQWHERELGRTDDWVVVESAVVQRNVWGTLRLGFTYVVTEDHR